MKYIRRNHYTSIEDIFLSHLEIDSKYDINEWYKKFYNDEYHIDGIDKACDMIKAFKSLPIHIIGDYDYDGRAALAIMKRGLQFFGCSDVHIRVPKPFSEGYGMKPEMIDEITDENALIITVDNGIAAHDAVARAKEKGYTVIVTDHHLPVKENDETVLPDADLVIDPNAITRSADYDAYCGAGLAFKIIRSLTKGMDGDKEFMYYLLPFAGTATICDVVQLHEENYVFVRKSIELLKNRKGPVGIQALLDCKYAEDITSDFIGFQVGPCINAPRRLYDDENITMPLFSSDDYNECRILAELAIEQNNERKRQLKTAEEVARRIIKEEHMEEDYPIVVHVPNVGEGIIGILAGHLKEVYHGPVLVFTDSANDDEILKGSGRSVDEVNLKDLLDSVKDCFVTYGGHAKAAGMCVKKDMLSVLREKINRSAAGIFHGEKNTPDVFEYDYEISVSDIESALNIQSAFEPTGEGNEKPVYKITGFRPATTYKDSKRNIGENGVKISGKDLSGNFVDALSFDLRGQLDSYSNISSMDLYGTLSWNVFRGTRKPQIEFTEFQVYSNINTTSLSDKLKSMAEAKIS